jgi:hypothetical protein
MGLRPGGYIFEGGTFAPAGEQTSHWLFFGLSPRGVRDYGALGEPVGHTRIDGAPATWWRSHGTGGVFAGHLTLVWRISGRLYGVSDHIGYPFNTTPNPGNGSSSLRALILQIARNERWFDR